MINPQNLSTRLLINLSTIIFAKNQTSVTMRKCFAIMATVGILMMVSCKGQKTCPTYLKNNGLENVEISASNR